MFIDRDDAARKLAKKLAAYTGKNPLVLAIPRGGVPMGSAIADALEGSFDVVLVRKLRAPFFEEVAIGAVDESGWTYLSDMAAESGASKEYIEEEKQVQLQTIRQRRLQYTPVHPPINPEGRIVIVVDDGLATGATMKAALHSLRAGKPAKLICAVPVAPRETLEEIAALADEVVCLEVPEYFQSVGQFYQVFDQVDDSQVIEILKTN